MKEVRLVLSKADFDYIEELLVKRKAKKSVIEAFTKANNDYLERTATKRTATKKATEARQKKVIDKIKNTIQMLKFTNENITIYKVAKEAKISYTTAKKYQNLINELVNPKKDESEEH